MFSFFISFSLSNKNLKSYFLKAPFTGKETSKTLEYPIFSKWVPVSRGEKADYVSDYEVGMPPNITEGLGVRVGVLMPDFEESPERVEITCAAPPGKKNSPNGKCKFNMHDTSSKTSSAYSVYPVNIDQGQTISRRFEKTILNGTICYITLSNNGTEFVYFGKPIVKFFFKQYDTVSNIKVDDKGKYKIISTELTKEVGKTTLRSIGIYNPYTPHPEMKNSKFFPIIANETHIIGGDLFSEDYFLWWRKNSLTTKGYTNETHFSVSFDPYSNDKIKFSYIFMEVKSTSLLDALEKWHATFPEIYNRRKLGNGAWVSGGGLKKYFNASAGNEFEDRDIYFAHWQWGSHYPSAKTYLPAFGYVEPFFLHTFNPYDPTQTDEQFLETVRGYASDENNKQHYVCDLISRYYVLSDKGKLYKNPYDTWAIVPVCYEGEVYERMYKSGQSYYNYSVKYPKIGVKVYGYGLDSFNMGYSHYPMNNNDVKMKSTMPFYYLSKEGKRNIPTFSGIMKFFNEVKEQFPYGHMENGCEIAPQFVKYLVHTGFEVFYCRGSTFKFDYRERNTLLSHRYEIGSLPFANLCNNYFINSEDLTENVFSIFLGYGIFPSTNGLFTSPDLLKKTRKYYLKWGDVFRTVCNNTDYFANALGKVKMEVNPEKQNPPLEAGSTYDFQDFSMFCDLENNTSPNPYCYLTVFLDYSKEHTVGNNFRRTVDITVDTNDLECFFVGPDMTCDINGNKAIITMSAKTGQTYRTSVLRFKKYKEDKTVFIAAVTSAILVPLALSVSAFVFVFIRRKKEEERNELQKEINV